MACVHNNYLTCAVSGLVGVHIYDHGSNGPTDSVHILQFLTYYT